MRLPSHGLAIAGLVLVIASCGEGRCVCTRASCAGCCHGDTNGACVSPPTSASCGSGGAACTACDAKAADRCTDGRCQCGGGPACTNGLRCHQGRCRCLVASDCPVGRVCLSDGSCRTCGGTDLDPSRKLACSSTTVNLACCGRCLDLQTSVASCGSFGRPCSAQNAATVSCTQGTCSWTCLPGWADCDSPSFNNGCETYIVSNPNHCGGCNRACPTSSSVCINDKCLLQSGQPCMTSAACASGWCLNRICQAR